MKKIIIISISLLFFGCNGGEGPHEPTDCQQIAADKVDNQDAFDSGEISREEYYTYNQKLDSMAVKANCK